MRRPCGQRPIGWLSRSRGQYARSYRKRAGDLQVVGVRFHQADTAPADFVRNALAFVDSDSCAPVVGPCHVRLLTRGMNDQGQFRGAGGRTAVAHVQYKRRLEDLQRGAQRRPDVRPDWRGQQPQRGRQTKRRLLWPRYVCIRGRLYQVQQQRHSRKQRLSVAGRRPQRAGHRSAGGEDRQDRAESLFTERFLIKRPLLQAIDGDRAKAPVLLIDELDRADEEFEGFLLELLADFQITVPELGTYQASHRPLVVITSNRTREIHDALKRRCLYFWIGYPDFQKELQIVTTRIPEAPRRLAEQVTGFIQELRQTELYKVPGISETLDWTTALMALNQEDLDPQVIDDTLGIMLKYQDDIELVRGEPVRAMLDRSRNRAPGRGRRRGS